MFFHSIAIPAMDCIMLGSAICVFAMIVWRKSESFPPFGQGYEVEIAILALWRFALIAALVKTCTM
jgi:hypothetical protein